MAKLVLILLAVVSAGLAVDAESTNSTFSSPVKELGHVRSRLHYYECEPTYVDELAAHDFLRVTPGKYTTKSEKYSYCVSIQELRELSPPKVYKRFTYARVLHMPKGFYDINDLYIAMPNDQQSVCFKVSPVNYVGRIDFEVYGIPANDNAD